MPLLLVLGLLLPMVLALAALARRRVEEAAPALMLGLALALNLLGLFGGLHAAIWLVYALWVASCGYVLWRVIQAFGKRRAWPLWLSVGALALLVAMVVLWWICRGRRYENWDEFSHWGRAVKAVYLQQVLPAVATVKDGFKEYPPGLAPLQAVVLRVLRMPFREDVVMFVQGLFSASLLLYPLRRFGRRNVPAALVLALLLFLAPTMAYWRFYTETTVDGLLGVLCAFVLLVQVLGEHSRWERLLQCMACAMLPMVKASGLLFALLAAGIVLVDDWRAGRGIVERGAVVAPKRAVGLRTWAGRLAPAGVGLLAAGAWNLYMRVYSVPRRESVNSFSLEAFAQLFTGQAPDWRYETAGSYAANLFTDFNYGWPSGFFPFMGFFVLFAALFVACRVLLRRRAAVDDALAGRTTHCFWGLWAGGLLYVLLLLGMYLFMLHPYESVRLSSLSRYLNTWLAAITVYLVGIQAAQLPFAKWQGRLGSLGLLLATWVFFGNASLIAGNIVQAPLCAADTQNIQRRYTQAAAQLDTLGDGPELRVYVIAQNDIGVTTLKLDYELLPKYLPEHVSSIGPDNPVEDMLVLRVTAAEWAELLAEGYDYVYLYELDDVFCAEYAGLFDDPQSLQEDGIYRVLAEGQTVRLQLVEEMAGEQ